MNITKTLTLSALTLILGCSTMAAPAGAFDPGNCDSTITNHTIFPAPAAAFVNIKPGQTPSSVAPVSTPGSTPTEHVGSQQGVTPAEDVPAQPVPYGSQQTPAVTGLPSAATPGFLTSWTPDCITIQNGEDLTWTNGDAEALHGILFGACFKGGALSVPGVDKDVLTFKYTPSGTPGAFGTLKVTSTSVRATNTANPGGVAAETPTVTKNCNANAIKGDVGLPTVIDAHTVDIPYSCILHHAAMTGHVRVKF